MDGVFMLKILRRLFICAFVTVLCWGVFLLSDRKALNDELIRFHVVANSDREEDQAIKLQVRDAVLSSIQEDLQKISDIEAAKAYLLENLPKIQSVAVRTLESLGYEGGAVVSLCKEAFDVRHYDTFSLPAGVYHSLRIVIGEGKGRNWWCVSFPTLCVPATAAAFEDAAVSSGFSNRLSEALSGNSDYKIRFFLLDKLGELENILFQP